jgi:N-glycosylase/DNA lyase
MTVARYERRIPDFNLALTLTGGQAFRWRRQGDEFYGVVDGERWRVTYRNGALSVEAVSAAAALAVERFAVRYFDLERDYSSAAAALDADAALQRFTAATSGVRILRQSWFETMIGFVVSANNRIPRIIRIIERLCEVFGDEKIAPDGPYFCFPSPERLATAGLAVLRNECNTGYRDRAIRDLSAHVVADHDFWHRRAAFAPTGELRRRLLALPGVGPKVAECILLFGFSRWEAFPIDTWTRRAVAALYLRDCARPTDKDIAAVARARFGPLAGFAQQRLFEAARLCSPRRRSVAPPVDT